MTTKFVDIKGFKFGKLTVEYRETAPPGKWFCRCDCGNTRSCLSGTLRRGRATSCGCGRQVDIAGQRFGRLTALRPAEREGRAMHWLCICDCGEETVVTGDCLRNGRTVSCGCFRLEQSTAVHTTHGLSGSPEYKIWNSMIQRCQSDHPNYGGRGIGVCDRWKNSFAAFYEDMGPRPDVSLTLDRKNSDGDYEPNNCRWADRTVQSVNQGISSTNKTGVKGVSITNTGKFLAELRVHGETKLKQQFDTLEEAAEARRQAESQHHLPLL